MQKRTAQNPLVFFVSKLCVLYEKQCNYIQLLNCIFISFWLCMYYINQMHNTTVTTLWSMFSFWGFLGGLFTLQVIREQIWKCGYSFYWKEQLSKYLTNWLHFQVITVVLLFKNSIYFFYFQLVLFYISNMTIVNRYYPKWIRCYNITLR